MHPEDYSMQIASFYFACFWIISWTLLAAIGGIIYLINKIKEKRNCSASDESTTGE